MSGKALVLEGGGLRGMFSAGVMDCLLEHDISFDYVIGVSAGISNAASFVSKQKGRNLEIIDKYYEDWHYKSIKSRLLTGAYFGSKFVFDDIPNQLVKFDYEALAKNPCRFLVGTTDIVEGKPVFFEKDDIEQKNVILRATCALPLLAPIEEWKGHKLLDGGLTCPVPIRKSIEDGNDKNVIILTRNKGFRKTKADALGMCKLIYRKYPKFVSFLENDYVKNYNETMDYIEKLEAEEKAFVIRPKAPIKVSRLEKEKRKIVELYNGAILETEDTINSLKKYLQD